MLPGPSYAAGRCPPPVARPALASIAVFASPLDAPSTAGANEAIAFGYGGDTYILVNDAPTALGSQDGLVRLNGALGWGMGLDGGVGGAATEPCPAD